MEFKPAEKKHTAKILSLIEKEFPNLQFTEQDINNKIDSESYFLFVLLKKEEITGFVEIVLIEDGVSRINALIIDSAHKGQKLGKELLQKTIEFLKEKKMVRIKILVDQNNETAKNLYQSMGFEFVSLYQLDQTGQTVEELELDLDTETPSYVG